MSAGVLLSLAVLAAACGRSAGSEYFPLNPGWRWTYDIHVTTMDGPQFKRFIVTNTGTARYQGRDFTIRRSADGAVGYFERTDNGVVRAGESRPEAGMQMFDSPATVLPAKLDKGTTWTQTEYTVALEHTGPPEHSLNRITVPVEIRYTVEETGDTVSLPIGTFTNCIRVRGKGATSKNVGFYVGETDIGVENTLWYAPGVGLVKASRLETTTSHVLPKGSYEMTLTQLER